MVTETNEYKGRRFKCSVCDGVVSSNAMSDFDVDDFYFALFVVLRVYKNITKKISMKQPEESWLIE